MIDNILNSFGDDNSDDKLRCFSDEELDKLILYCEKSNDKLSKGYLSILYDRKMEIRIDKLKKIKKNINILNS